MVSARAAWWVALGMLLALLSACERTPVEQRGARGLGMVLVGDGLAQAVQADINAVPPVLRRVSATGPTAGDEYSNVQLLGDMSKAEFARLMLSFKNWIAPEEGCGYCHDVPDYASDTKAPKLVARAMIRMTREINTAWSAHVKGTGVTCYTCHRGQPIPPRVWFANPERARGAVSLRPQLRMPTPSAANSLMHADALSEFLLDDHPIRVTATAPLKGGPASPIRNARSTFALMTVMSESLGVNCTFCHNSRAYGAWDESPPQRITAWHGLRMVRELNGKHLNGLAALLQPAQRGPAGDGPKVYCATCHVGINRPLNGVNMVKDFPELIGTKADVAASPPPAAMAVAAPRPGVAASAARP